MTIASAGDFPKHQNIALQPSAQASKDIEEEEVVEDSVTEDERTNSSGSGTDAIIRVELGDGEATVEVAHPALTAGPRVGMVLDALADLIRSDEEVAPADLPSTMETERSESATDPKVPPNIRTGA